MMSKLSGKTFLRILVLLLVAVLSVTCLRGVLTSTSTYSGTIREIDREKSSIIDLLTASTSASIVVTLIPDDVGTPIADKLAGLSSIFIAALSVLYAEKYLMTVFGFVVSVLLIPALCVVMFLYLENHQPRLREVLQKLAALALVLVFTIPCGVGMSGLIENTYKESIDLIVSQAIEPEKPTEIVNEDESESESEEKNVWQAVGDWFGQVAKDVSDSVTGAVDWAKTVLNNFIEATAVLIVTSCVIPLLTFWVFKTFIGKLLGVDISHWPKLRLPAGSKAKNIALRQDDEIEKKE